MLHLYENYFQLNFQFLVPWEHLTIMFSHEPVIHGHWEEEETYQIIKSVPKDIQGSVSCSSLSVTLFSSDFKRLQQWDSSSKRPVGALSLPKALHFRKKYSDIKSCYTTWLSQRSPTSLPWCPLAPPDASSFPHLFIFPSPSSFFFIFF